MDRPPVRVLPPPDDPGTENEPRRRTRTVWVAGYVVVLLVAAVAVGMFSAWMASPTEETAALTGAVPTATAASLPTALAIPAKSTPSGTATHESDQPALKLPPVKAGPGQKPASSAPKKGGKPAATATKPAAVKAQAITAAGSVVTTSVVEGTAYSFLNSATSKCVTVDGGTFAQYGCGSRGGQLWALERTRSAYSLPLYRLRSRSSNGTCIHTPALAKQTTLTVTACPTIDASAGSNDEWKLQDIGATHQGRRQYALINVASNLCLDVLYGPSDGSDKADGRSYSLFTCQDDDGDWDDHLWVFS